MEQGTITVFCGSGMEKTTCAIGEALRAAQSEKSVILIQFLRGKVVQLEQMLKQLDPSLKMFSFEKFEKPYAALTAEEREEEIGNVKNGFNYAKKVLSVNECDILILDNVLDLMEFHIIEMADFLSLLAAKDEGVDLYLTGQHCPIGLVSHTDRLVELKTTYRSGKKTET